MLIRKIIFVHTILFSKLRNKNEYIYICITIWITKWIVVDFGDEVAACRGGAPPRLLSPRHVVAVKFAETSKDRWESRHNIMHTYTYYNITIIRTLTAILSNYSRKRSVTERHVVDDFWYFTRRLGDDYWKRAGWPSRPRRLFSPFKRRTGWLHSTKT